MDFIERAPEAGDVLFHAFQRLRGQDNPGYLKLPVILSSSMSSAADSKPSSQTSDHEMNSDDEMKCNSECRFNDGACQLLWEFIFQLLQDTKWSRVVCWESRENCTFHILDPTNLADAWGRLKNRTNMTYEKLSRALRYYYKTKIIKKVTGKKLIYQFLTHPTKIQKCQRGAKANSNRRLNVKVAKTDACTPDSSTSSTTTSRGAVRQLSSNSNSSESRPMHDHIVLASPENLTPVPLDRQDILEPHVVSFCPNSKVTTYQQELVLYDGITNLETNNSDASVNAYSDHHFEVTQSRSLDNFYSEKKCRSVEGEDIIFRSISSSCSDDDYLSSYKEINTLDKTSHPVMDTEYQSALFQNCGQSVPRFSTTSHSRCIDNSYLCQSALGEQQELLYQYDHKTPQQISTQDFTKEMNFSCQRNPQQLRNQLPTSHQYASDLACFNQVDQSVHNNFYLTQPVNQGIHEQLQSEPEDLSMKTYPPKNHIRL